MSKNSGKDMSGIKSAGATFASTMAGGLTTGLLTAEDTSAEETVELQEVTEDEKLEEVEFVDEENTEEAVEAEAIEAEPVAPAGVNVNININVNVPPTAQVETVQNDEPVVATAEPEPVVAHEPVVIGDVELATNVDDSMSFNEAFAAARHEVGAGGVFVWHGNSYNTFYKEEWDAMSADERNEFMAEAHHAAADYEGGYAYEPEPVDPIDEPVLAGLGDEPYDEPYDEPEPFEENPDLDLMASNYTDPSIPIDNNMDMSDFA